ncbi:mitochondrial 18 KDa protein-domain-containing protein [Mrakia frigida]|uniref:mitochondrial fission process 1 family protein n=1 Tax=Mrakia frigida TaxID=29902 RepID=UPI003FCC06B9
MSAAVEQVISNVEQEGERELAVMVKEDFDTTDSNARYLAYGNRLRTALRASSRYVAYTSDIGESFRPVVPPWVVTAGYGVSWAYLIGDVSYETYKAKQQGPTPLEAANFSEATRLSMYATKRAIFQAAASMALPALTIHSAVKYSAKAFVNQKNPRIRAWGPSAIGLAIVPALPYIFDHPVEYATDVAFDKLEHALQTVASLPPSPGEKTPLEPELKGPFGVKKEL